MPSVRCWSGRQFLFEPERSALVVVDMQRDFFTPGSTEMQAVIPHVTTLLATARAAGMQVVHTREVYDSSDSEDVNAYKRHLGYVGRPSEHGPYLIRGSDGYDFLEGFGPRAGEIVVDKAGFSAFYGTDLHSDLTERGISHLIVCGVTTQCCVHSTLRDAVERGYFCLTMEDACAAEEPTVHEATMTVIQAENHLFGWIAGVADFATSLA